MFAKGFAHLHLLFIFFTSPQLSLPFFYLHTSILFFLQLPFVCNHLLTIRVIALAWLFYLTTLHKRK